MIPVRSYFVKVSQISTISKPNLHRFKRHDPWMIYDLLKFPGTSLVMHYSRINELFMIYSILYTDISANRIVAR